MAQGPQRGVGARFERPSEESGRSGSTRAPDRDAGRLGEANRSRRSRSGSLPPQNLGRTKGAGLRVTCRLYAVRSQMPTSTRWDCPGCLLGSTLNQPKRLVRIRTHGGVGGREPRGSPLSRSSFMLRGQAPNSTTWLRQSLTVKSDHVGQRERSFQAAGPGPC